MIDRRGNFDCCFIVELIRRIGGELFGNNVERLICALCIAIGNGMLEVGEGQDE